jgi:hypothetical protein
MPYTDSVTDKENPVTDAPAYQILLSVRLSSMCPHNKLSNTCCGNAEWMRVIHAVNADHAKRNPAWASEWDAAGEPTAFETTPQYIAAPTSTYEQSGGRWFEEYPSFRVILSGAGNGGYVQAKTPEAVEYLHRAVKEVTGRDVDQNGMAI